MAVDEGEAAIVFQSFNTMFYKGTEIAMLMNALVKKEAVAGLCLQQVAVPQPAFDQVLVKVLRTAICGTDVHIYNWDSWAQQSITRPMTVGHEFVGEIVRIGSGVQECQLGDVVSGEGHVVCGTCRNCLEGRRHLCSHSVSLGIDIAGAFAEYVVVPEKNIWRHKAGIDLDIATLFDPLGNAVHACSQFPVLAEDVLVTGAGPIGIMATAVARAMGARSVVVTDMNRQRLDLAGQLGATASIHISEQSLHEAVQNLDVGDGFGVGLEMSGSSQALADMVDVLRYGGNIAMLGIPVERIDINWHRVLFGMMTIRGVSGRRIFETWRTVSVLLESGLDVSAMIAQCLPYSAFQEGFSYLLDGGAGKVILDWS